jgi:eukaryotic-like serine/threonine-protein kinase
MAAGNPRPKPVPPDSPVQPGDMVAGKYRVDSVIAVGGMGMVVEAEHLQLGQKVAIKVLLPTELAQEPHAAARFLREARAAARIGSDHVVRIYDVDTLPDGLPYMVMERLYGSDLRALLRSRGPLPIEDVIHYVTEACDAVGEAHRMGIVHRDLKPSNLFLTAKHGGREIVKVLDFGISKAAHHAPLEATLTTSRTLIGSPLYMSPEQIRDPKSVDARSDIWSLGIILHQLLTGKPAFTADSLPAVCAAIAADPPASTRQRRHDVPEPLERVILRCLEKNPDARYSTVDELCEALSPFGRAEPALTSRSGRLQPADPGDGVSALGFRAVSEEKGCLPEISGASLRSDAPLAATRRTAELPGRRKLRVALLLSAGLLALATATGLALLLRGGEEPAPERAAAPAPQKVNAFALRVESTPPGAEVFDGQRRLGETPLVVRLDNPELERAPKRFTLRLGGYEPFVFERGPSESDVSERAELEPLAQASPAVSAAPAPAATRQRRAPGAKPTAAPTPAAGTDIRLER